MRLAFVYDRINKIGGAERVLTALHEIWPEAPFFTAVYNPNTTPYAKNWDVRSSFLQHLPFAKTHHEWFVWATPFAFESFNFNEFDVVISVTSAEAKGIITKPETLHVCYCLTPTRYLWSHAHEYGHQLLLSKLRAWDYIAAQRPDQYLAISKTVQSRIKKYYHRDSEIIYPGINTDFFKPLSANHYSLATSHYFLVVSRLVPYKHIDIAIQACNALQLSLKIIGTGSHLPHLKKLAGPTIEFLGQLTDQQVLGYYQECAAVIFPGEEDLGLTLLEAQSCGKPVIAYKGGGASEIIQSGTTGLFFDTLSPSALSKALKLYEHKSFDSSTIRQHALAWNIGKYKQQFKARIEELWQKHQNLPQWELLFLPVVWARECGP